MLEMCDIFLAALTKHGYRMGKLGYRYGKELKLFYFWQTACLYRIPLVSNLLFYTVHDILEPLGQRLQCRLLRFMFGSESIFSVKQNVLNLHFWSCPALVMEFGHWLFYQICYDSRLAVTRVHVAWSGLLRASGSTFINISWIFLWAALSLTTCHCSLFGICTHYFFVCVLTYG